MTYAVTIVDTTGAKQSEVTVDALEDSVVNQGLIHEYVVMYLANQRQSGAHTKTRGEVRRSGRKLYRQKGTGNARVGDAGSPIRRKGGVAMGPRSTRNWSKSMPQKMRRKALVGSLTLQAKSSALYGVESLSYDTPSTKQAATLLDGIRPGSKSVLVVTGAASENVYRSFRNVANVSVIPFSQLNAYEVMKSHTILFTNDALASLKSLTV